MPSHHAATLDRTQLAAFQIERLQSLLVEILPANQFYQQKFAQSGMDASSVHTLQDLQQLPFTTKQELLEDQKAHPRFGTLLTYPLAKYCRYHQTSGTTGSPLRWLDTVESWQWMLDCWRQIFTITGVQAEDRLFFPFSFGPFLGFWTAFEAAEQHGCLLLPGGGLSTVARLNFLLENEATVVLCTPTYALHLAQVAAENSINLVDSQVWALIVAGEPGGNIPTTRAAIEAAWGARVFDHSGLTEVGPLTIESPDSPGGLYILEGDYCAEIIDPDTGENLGFEAQGELVVTNLGRWGSPLIRYRTGDLVRGRIKPETGLNFLWLEGGILGRSDDLIYLRGNNVYPSAIEAIIREFPEIIEFRIEVDETGPLADLRIEIEPSQVERGSLLAKEIATVFRDRLFFRADVHPVAPESLPRFEMKARRLVRKKR
ncbi:MAG: phenylacetate--CoA ligase family protein [Gemmataceae bacterium]